MKKIDWLEQFADDYNKTMTKTASAKKKAQQVIVDRSEFPKAVNGSLVSYANAQYKVVNAEFEDEQGPGMILEKVSDFEDGGCEDGTCVTDEKECGDSTVTLADLKGLFENDVPEVEEETVEEEVAEDEIPEAVDEVVEEPKEDYYGSDKRTAPSQELGTQKNVTDAPYHPTGNPGNDFAVTKTHPDEYEDAARKTEEQIKNEDSQDRTTVDGYYTWNKNRILDRIVAELTGIEEPSVEEMLSEEEFDIPEETKEVVDEEVFEDEPVEEISEDVLSDAEEEMTYQQEQGVEDQSIEINEIVAPEETAPVNEISNTEPPQQEEPTGEFTEDVFETVSDETVEELPEDVLADIEALEDEVIEELKEELFEGLEDDVIEEIKEEVLEELKNEVLDEIKEEVVEDIKEEVSDETPVEETFEEELPEDEVVEDEFVEEEIPADDEAVEEESFEEEEIPEDDEVVEDELELPEDDEVEEKEEVASRKSRFRR